MRARMRPRFVAIVMAAVAAVAIAAGLVTWHQRTPRSTVPANMQAALDPRAKAAVEQDLQPGWCEADPGPHCAVRCDVTVFGMDPKDADQAGAVTTAYASTDCRLYSGGKIKATTGDLIALHFTTPPTIEAEGDTPNPAWFDQIFPKRLRKVAKSYE